MKLPEGITERLLDGESPETVDSGLRERLDDTADGRELLANLEFASLVDKNLTQSPGLTEEQMGRLWEAANRNIDSIQTKTAFVRYQPSLPVRVLRRIEKSWRLATDAFSPVGKMQWRKEPLAVSEELVERGYPMTREQRDVLGEIMEKRGIFEQWRQRKRASSYARWGLATACLMALAATTVFLVIDRGPNEPEGPFGELQLTGFA